MGGGKPQASTPARVSPRHFPSIAPAPPSVIPAQTEIHTSPATLLNRATIPRRTKVRSMPTSPHSHQPPTSDAAIHTGAPPNNPEQIRTTLNTAERSDQIEPAPGSPPNNPEQIRTDPNTAEHHDQIEPAPGSPPNNPEQIRTNLNIAERSDQIGPPFESPRNTRKKQT